MRESTDCVHAKPIHRHCIYREHSCISIELAFLLLFFFFFVLSLTAYKFCALSCVLECGMVEQPPEGTDRIKGALPNIFLVLRVCVYIEKAPIHIVLCTDERGAQSRAAACLERAVLGNLLHHRFHMFFAVVAVFLREHFFSAAAIRFCSLPAWASRAAARASVLFCFPRWTLEKKKKNEKRRGV